MAQRGRMSRGGNSPGYSTSPSISRCTPEWPIWRRRWPSTPTTIWWSTATHRVRSIANLEKGKLAGQYPVGSPTPVPDIDFVLSGDPNIPNGGLAARFPVSTFRFLMCRWNGSRTNRHSVRHGCHHPAVRRLFRFPVVSAQCHLPWNALLGAVYLHPVRPRRQPACGAGQVDGTTRAPRAELVITSSRRRTCRCSLRCAAWGCPSR